MISVELATPVILYEQLPDIAKKLNVNADFFERFLHQRQVLCGGR